MLSFLAIVLTNCGGSTTATAQLFKIQLDAAKNDFKNGQQVGITIENKKQKTIDQVTYSIDGEILPLQDDTVTLNAKALGNKVLKAEISFEGNTVEVSKNIKLLAADSPAIYTYEIINTYPHDIDAYTQGLEFYDDVLYESTGLRGKSSLRKVDYKTGSILKQIDLDASFFGEGITILNNKIYMLSWQKQTGFIFDLESFEELDQFKYNQSKEGWGLCNNGERLYKSDGTEKIWLLNPETLTEEDYIETVTNRSIFNKANELEYVNGKIYANVYQKESMMIIDAASGAIEGVINFGGLKDKVTAHEQLNVLNGVAYHPTRETFFVTGKNWDKLFEVKITKK